MTLEDSTPEALSDLPTASVSNDDEEMSVLVEPYGPSTPGGTHEASSDYGDFASDEEEIINHLLERAIPPSASVSAPLLVTDIEDYEEPRGVRFPKVLGVERSPPAWLPQVQLQNHDQAVRHSSIPQGTCGRSDYSAAAH